MHTIVSLILTVAFICFCLFVSSVFNLDFEKSAIGGLAFLKFYFDSIVVQHLNGEN